MESSTSFAIGQVEEKPDHGDRRRIQNRLAQRRFREKAKNKGQSPAGGGQGNMKDEKRDNQSDSGLYSAEFSSSSSNSGVPIPWNHFEISPHSFQRKPPMPIEQISNAEQAVKNPIPYISQFNAYPGGLDFCRPGMQFNDTAIPFTFPDIDALMPNKISLSSQFEGDVPPNQGDLGSERKKRKQSVSRDRNSMAPSSQRSTPIDGQGEAALATLEKQRTELCSQAEQLLDKTISLYDIGLSLGIVPSNPRLRHHLESAFRDFRSLRQNEDASSADEGGEDDTSEHEEEIFMSPFSLERASGIKK